MYSLLYVLLFAVLFALMLLLIYPDRYAISPASVSLDYIRRSVENSYSEKSRLEILGKTVGGIIKSSFFISVCMGMLGFLLAFSRLRWFAVIPGVICFAIGLSMSQAAVGNEFRRWQAKVFSEVPTLIGVMPAFLKVGGITLREAITMTLPFIHGPLQEELLNVIDRIKRTGNSKDPFDLLAKRIDHPCMESICLRLSTSWDASPSPDIFSDLSDQIEEIQEIAAAGTTAGRAGLLALICVLALIGSALAFGYPAAIYAYGIVTSSF